MILTNSGDSSLQQQVVCDWQAWAVPASMDSGCPGLYDIYAMKSDGTDSRRIIGNLGSDLMPRWAPNGQRIAFHRGPGGACRQGRQEGL